MTPTTRPPGARPPPLGSSAAYATCRATCGSAPLTTERFLALEPRLQDALKRSWAFNAPPHQWPPEEGGWSTWLFLGGRGAGKTRAGAEWLCHRAETAPGRFALVGPTLHDVREVMIEGASGLRAIRRGAERPVWQAARRRLVWEGSGAQAYAFSAEDPDSLRGPQFHAAWADEFCAWRAPDAALSNLRLGLRLGERPRLALTTTPRPIPALRRLLAEPGCLRSDAPTAANAANLAPDFLVGLQALYGGTRLAAQELDGLLVEDEGAALWRAEQFARLRGPAPIRLERVVLAVDPPATSHGDACGLVVAGRAEERGYVLADRTTGGLSPLGWGGRAAAVAREFGAHAIVAEANQGGDMVRTVLQLAEPPCPVRLVHAARAKRVRAAPVAALYEQGRVTHCGAFPRLEEELLALGSSDLTHSPDRADALVWALADLLLDRPASPRVSVL